MYIIYVRNHNSFKSVLNNTRKNYAIITPFFDALVLVYQSNLRFISSLRIFDRKSSYYEMNSYNYLRVLAGILCLFLLDYTKRHTWSFF